MIKNLWCNTFCQLLHQNENTGMVTASGNIAVTAADVPLPSGFRPSPQTGQSSPRGDNRGARRPNTLTAASLRPSKKRSSGIVGRIRTWNKDIVCLSYSRDSHFPIPRGKQSSMLAEKGLIGKLRIISSWSEAQVCSILKPFSHLRPNILYIDDQPRIYNYLF